MSKLYRIIKNTQVLLLALVYGGCAERLSPQSEVSKLRVLAIAADSPEVQPGATVAVEAVWADPMGEGRPVGFVWTSCLLGPGGDPRSCTESGAEATLLALGEGLDRLDVVVPEDALDGELTDAILLVAVLVCAGGLPELSDTEEVVCPEDESVLAYKRIVVSDSQQPNQNPTIDRVGFGGQTWSTDGIPVVDACPEGDCFGWEIEVSPPEGAAERYVEESPEGGEVEVTEELLVSFFSTGGEFDRVRAVDEANVSFRAGWRAPPEAGDVTFWLVLRDGRGGLSYAERTVLVR